MSNTITIAGAKIAVPDRQEVQTPVRGIQGKSSGLSVAAFSYFLLEANEKRFEARLLQKRGNPRTTPSQKKFPLPLNDYQLGEVLIAEFDGTGSDIRTTIREKTFGIANLRSRYRKDILLTGHEHTYTSFSYILGWPVNPKGGSTAHLSYEQILEKMSEDDPRREFFQQ